MSPRLLAATVFLATSTLLASLAPNVLAAPLSPLAPTPEPRSTSASSTGPRSPAVAAALSLGTTLAGYALVATARQVDHDTTAAVLFPGLALTLVGPSIGHFYAGETRRGIATTVVRGAGYGLVVAGIASALDSGCDDCEPFRDGGPAIWLGLGVIAGATIYDLIDAPRAARRHNRAAAIQVAPTALTTGTGTAPGLVVAGSF